jgi:hypothetical protein
LDGPPRLPIFGGDSGYSTHAVPLKGGNEAVEILKPVWAVFDQEAA